MKIDLMKLIASLGVKLPKNLDAFFLAPFFPLLLPDPGPAGRMAAKPIRHRRLRASLSRGHRGTRKIFSTKISCVDPRIPPSSSSSSVFPLKYLNLSHIPPIFAGAGGRRAPRVRRGPLFPLRPRRRELGDRAACAHAPPGFPRGGTPRGHAFPQARRARPPAFATAPSLRGSGRRRARGAREERALLDRGSEPEPQQQPGGRIEGRAPRTHSYDPAAR